MQLKRTKYTANKGLARRRGETGAVAAAESNKVTNKIIID